MKCAHVCFLVAKMLKMRAKFSFWRFFFGFRVFFMAELCEWKIYEFFGFQAIIWEKCFLINLECRHVCITISLFLSFFFFVIFSENDRDSSACWWWWWNCFSQNHDDETLFYYNIKSHWNRKRASREFH